MASPFSAAVLLALLSIQGEQLIQTDLAWAGAVSSTAFTELTLRAATSMDATVAFEVAGPSTVVATSMQLHNGEPAIARMPVVSGDLDGVVLRYSVDDAPWQELDAGRLERGPGEFVLVGESAINVLGDVPGTTIVAANDLPGLSSAYTHVAAVALGGDALGRLDEAQLRAFLEYVGLCGRVLLIDPTDQVKQLVSQRAACGRRYFATSSADGDIATALEMLMTRGADRLPDEQALGGLLESRGADIRLIAFYLGGFLLIFVVLTAAPRSRGVALAFSVLLTALAGFFWDGGNKHVFVAWAETTTTDSVARYSSLERASATGRGPQVLQLQSLARSPMHITGRSLVLNWSEIASERHLDWSASLLQEMRVFAMGSFPVEPRLRASADGTEVIVCNRSDGHTQPAYLHWQGNNYEVPALAPGERWTTNESNITVEVSAHLRLLAHRTANSELALLRPLEVPSNGSDQRAWLMTTETDARGVPCRA